MATILAVHADDAVLEEIEQALDGQHQLIRAHDSQEAINSLDNISVDALIVDVATQPVDGWRLSRLVRSGALSTNARLPVFIFSSTFYSRHLMEATAREYGINACIAQEDLPQLLVHLDMHLASIDNPRLSRVLAIDDYPDILDLVKRILRNRFEVTIAADGEQGLALWREGDYDLVLLDVMLPKLSGPQVLDAIMKENPQQAVVMMTAFGVVDNAADLLSAGAVDFLPKPFKADQLRRVCDIAIRREDFMRSHAQFSQYARDLAIQHERTKVTLDSIGDGVVTTNASGEVDYMNPIAREIFACDGSEQCRTAINETLQAGIKDGETETKSDEQVTIIELDEDGRVIELKASPIFAGSTDQAGCVMILHDVTEARRLTQKLSYQATHDALTGLLNRKALEQQLDTAIEEARNGDVEHVLLAMDLDRFKAVNDSCGHAAGDILLKNVSNMMQSMLLRSGDNVFRVGGDEFIILLKSCGTSFAKKFADDLVKAVKHMHFDWEGQNFSIGVSVGVASIKDVDTNRKKWLAAADMAAYQAKTAGRNQANVYDPAGHGLERQQVEVSVISLLVQALDNHQLNLYYQSQFDAQNQGGHIEILLRLGDGDGGYVPSDQVFSASERNGLCVDLDKEVISQCFNWFKKHAHVLEQLDLVSINLSAASIRDNDLGLYIQQKISESGLPPSKFCFEVSDSILHSQFSSLQRFSTILQQCGFKLSLDNFKGSMASFSQLRQLSLNYLKIDGCFTQGGVCDQVGLEVFKAIINVAHSMNLQTVAEIVESTECVGLLREIGIDFVQGFALSTPRELEALL